MIAHAGNGSGTGPEPNLGTHLTIEKPSILITSSIYFAVYFDAACG